MRPKSDPYNKVSARDRVAARIAALLDDPARAQCYKDLFELRSCFVHGRAGLQRLPTSSRVSARSLASDVARTLVNLAVQPSGTRAVVLTHLLDKGVQFL
jgi:hypothetical protein